MTPAAGASGVAVLLTEPCSSLLGVTPFCMPLIGGFAGEGVALQVSTCIAHIMAWELPILCIAAI